VTTSVDAAAPAPALTPLQCARCGAEGVGRFCSNCGSALADRKDLTVRHFLREAAAAITDLDSALISSFRALLFRPGQLTAAYFRGERHRYLPPFRVFLLCNLLYFVVVAQFGITVLTAPLEVQLDAMTYRSASRAIMVKRYPALVQTATPGQRERAKALRASLTTRYDSATDAVAKLIVVVLIPFYALVLQALFVGTRRFFAEHLVFATHLVGFILLCIPATGLALTGYYRILILTTSFRGSDSELPYVVSVSLLFSTYAYVAQRTVYGSGRLATAVRTALLVATIVPIIVAFKFVLFLVTLYWIA
jgi:Protein of unknown function (DUF3667)